MKRLLPIPILCLSLTCLLAAPTPPPRPAFTRLTVEDGLSNNSVLCMLQDRSGIFWIGTNGGLNRYDGISFVQYSILSHPALISNTITTLLQDKSGRIWIGTEDGLEIMDPATDSLQPFQHNNNDRSSLPQGPIRGLKQMTDGSIWILSEAWLAKYTLKGNFERIAIDPSLLAQNKVFSYFTEDRQDKIWLSYLDQATALAEQVGLPNDRDSLAARPSPWAGYVDVYIDSTGTKWGVSPYGVDRYDNNKGLSIPWLKNTYARDFPSLHLHTCFTTDADGNIWQAARIPSLVRYDLARRRVDDLSWLLTAANASLVYCLYRDANNTIWIGTDNGIIKFSGRSSFFRNIPIVLNGTEQRDIRCRKIVETGQGTLYAGTESHGFLQLTPTREGYSATRLSLSGNPDISWLPMKDNYFLIPVGQYNIGFIYDFCDQDSSVLWFAGYGIGRYDPRSPTIQVYLSDGDAITRHESIVQFSICPDGKRFWLGGQFDIYVFDLATLRMQPFTDAGNTRPFHGVSTWCIRKSGGWIWAGTSKGLYKIDPKTRQVEKASLLPSMEYAINDICIDTDSTFWLSTAGGGLVHFDPKTGQARQYTTADGLSNNTLCGALIDAGRNLWISTYAGLDRFDRRSAQFTVFYAKDGLGMDEFNRKAFTRLRDGRLIFGGLDGYIIFDPQAVYNAYMPATIRLRSTSLQKLEIPPGDKFFSVSYALTDLYDPKGDRYFYKLEGIDNDWYFIGNQHTLSFTSLPPGRYTLHVKGVAANSLPAKNEIVLPIEVQQVFYKRAWFVAVLILALAILTYGIVQYRINQWKKLQQLRTKIAGDLHDEIGSNLVRITMLADQASARTGPNTLKTSGAHETRATFDTIAAISRNAVSTIKDVVWSIDARYDTMVGMIDYMQEHMHNMLAPADIDFSFRHDGLHMEEKLNMSFRQNVYLIYKESINNIVKHACATEVNVELQSREGVFIMNIKDNGRGMRQDRQRSGHGLGNMQLRASRIKGKLDIRSHKDGVTISLEAPYKKKII